MQQLNSFHVMNIRKKLFFWIVKKKYKTKGQLVILRVRKIRKNLEIYIWKQASSETKLHSHILRLPLVNIAHTGAIYISQCVQIAAEIKQKLDGVALLIAYPPNANFIHLHSRLGCFAKTNNYILPNQPICPVWQKCPNFWTNTAIFNP